MANASTFFALALLVFASGCVLAASKCRNATDVYEETFPSIAEETYEAREPYIVYLKHLIEESRVSSEKSNNTAYSRAVVKLRNTDAEEGWFTVIFEFESAGGNILRNSRQKVKPGELGTFAFVHEAAEEAKGSAEFSQSDPVTKYRVIIKNRAVAKYITETRNMTRTVCE